MASIASIMTPFCGQAADLVHVCHFGLASGAYCLNCDPSFCRQAADLVHVFHFGLPNGILWLSFDNVFVERLQTWYVYQQKVAADGSRGDPKAPRATQK